MFGEARSKREQVLMEQNKEFLNKEAPIGLEFEYLGVRMRVTNHWQYIGGCSGAPGVVADYFDKNGVLCKAFFPMHEAREMFDSQSVYAVKLC